MSDGTIRVISKFCGNDFPDIPTDAKVIGAHLITPILATDEQIRELFGFNPSDLIPEGEEIEYNFSSGKDDDKRPKLIIDYSQNP